MNMPLALTNRRRRGGAASAPVFSPADIFSTGSQGIWLDPSDLSTMFSDRAGTTPVTTPGTVVGLRLDKSKGLTLGAELVTPVANQDFSSDTGYWVKGSGATISGGKANFSASSGYALFRGSISGIAVGGYYEVTFTVSDYVSGSIRPYLGSTPAFGASVSANGTYTARLAPNAGGEAGFNSASAFTGSIDNVSIKAITGNHAVAPTDAARPIYGVEPKGGRRNLLTWSEDFRDTAAAGETRPWAYNGISTVTANATTAPDGTLTADKLVETAAGGGHYLRQNIALTGANTYTVYAKAAERSQITLFCSGTNKGIGFDLTTGAIIQTTDPDPDTYSAVSVGNGWWRLTISTASGTVTNVQTYLMAGGVYTYTGDGTSGLFLWGAQLELGSTATAYQRTTTAYDVTESGVATCHYVQYDGSDDSMSTAAINFTGTDKMSVFAGVRKLSDGSRLFVEMSVDAPNNAGAFYVVAATDTGVLGAQNGYSSLSRGSVAASVNQCAQIVVAAPDSAVLTVTHDIAGDLSTIRRNGAAGTSATADKGAGNFGNYPMFFGRRNNSQFPFSGKDYGIIIVGKAASAGEITDTETWLAARTSGVSI